MSAHVWRGGLGYLDPFSLPTKIVLTALLFANRNIRHRACSKHADIGFMSAAVTMQRIQRVLNDGADKLTDLEQRLRRLQMHRAAVYTATEKLLSFPGCDAYNRLSAGKELRSGFGLALALDEHTYDAYVTCQGPPQSVVSHPHFHDTLCDETWDRLLADDGARMPEEAERQAAFKLDTTAEERELRTQCFEDLAGAVAARRARAVGENEPGREDDMLMEPGEKLLGGLNDPLEKWSFSQSSHDAEVVAVHVKLDESLSLSATDVARRATREHELPLLAGHKGDAPHKKGGDGAEAHPRAATGADGDGNPGGL